jgi:flagellar hook-length control protein FliK
MDIRADLPPNAPSTRSSQTAREERAAPARDRFELAPEAKREEPPRERVKARSADDINARPRHAEERPESASRRTQDRTASSETPASQTPQDDEAGSSKETAAKEDPAAADATVTPDQATDTQAPAATQLPIFVMGQPPVPPEAVARAAGLGPTAAGAATAPGGKAQPLSMPPSGPPGMAAGTSDAGDDGETTASATSSDGEAIPSGAAEHLPAKVAAAMAEGAPLPGQGPNPAGPDPSFALLPPAPAPGGAVTGAHGAPAPTEAGPRHVVEGVPISAVPVEIGLKSLQGINRFDIRLDPEDLGRIDVRLDISDEGRVRAHIVVEQPAALATLQREASLLERALEQAGFRTGSDGISLGLRGEGDGRAGQGERQGSPPSGVSSRAAEAADAAPPPPAWNIRWSRASGIDRRV